jgi:hypothetical protein
MSFRNASRTLHKHVSHCFGPRNTVLHCIGKGNRWLNNRMAYVAVSRGAYDAQLFTNDR